MIVSTNAHVFDGVRRQCRVLMPSLIDLKKA